MGRWTFGSHFNGWNPCGAVYMLEYLLGGGILVIIMMVFCSVGSALQMKILFGKL